MRSVGSLAIVTFAVLVATADARGAEPAASAARRGVAYLKIEVPRWAAEQHCYSCHNNGDAVRALVAAVASGELVERQPLADSLRFLTAPDAWDANGPDGPFKDKKLARVQFAAALADAEAARLVPQRQALPAAAALVAELQTPDGCWDTDAPADVGSPATYGRPLTTAMAMRVLRAADSRRYAGALDRAERWLLAKGPQNVLEASATLWALAATNRTETAAVRERCLAVLAKGQSSDGGWGPFATSPPEAFDTALAVLALCAQRDRAVHAERIRRGRDYLIATQRPDGSWPATTRPSGADSYAQQVSTTAWATLALLAK